MKRLFQIIIILIIAPCAAVAEISVSLSLDRYEAAFVDSVKMTVSISGSRDAETPDIKGLENFKVQKGGQSSRVQIVNGKVSSGLDLTYYLQPKRTGIFDIGPAYVRIDGKVYQSSAVKLDVKQKVDQKDVKDPVFLTASISSKKVYLEEHMVYTVRLYHVPEISNLSLAMPELEGLSFKQLGKPVEYNTVYNSRNYRVIEVRYSLVPSKAGRFEIYPAKMSMLVRASQAGQDDFDDFFSMDDFFSRARGKPITLASNSLSLDVLPVPEKGKPLDYSGLVGRFQISAELEPARIKAGESATLTVVLKGTGNVNRIPDMEVPDIEGLKIYSDEPSLDVQQGQNGIQGTKTMKWAIVPEKEGKYTIPPLSISFFDTGKRAYKKISTSSFLLNVDPGAGGITQPQFARERTAQVKKPVEELGEDILPIHKSVRYSSDISRKPGLILWILIFPAFIYCAFFAVFIIKRPNPRKEAKLKAYKAAKIFYKKCRDKELSANDLSEALREYYNSRFNLKLGSITSDESNNILHSRGCSEETAKQMEWMLKKIETLIYTGKGSDPGDLSDEAAIIIRSIEKEIK